MKHVQMADTQKNKVAKQRVRDLETRMTTVQTGRSQDEYYLRTAHSGQGIERAERQNMLRQPPKPALVSRSYCGLPG